MNSKIVPKWAVLAALSCGYPLNPAFESLITGAIEHNQQLEEIALIAKLTTDEVREFYQVHSYDLEFIKIAMQAGAELNEESIKQTMVKKYL